MEIDTFLAPYPEEQHATWKYLTSMVITTSDDILLYPVSYFHYVTNWNAMYVCSSCLLGNTRGSERVWYAT